VTEQQQKDIFENWLSLHKGLVFKVVRAYTTTSIDQDDLFQDIFLQIWHSVRSFRHESAVTTWIYRVSLNTAIKWTRKKRHPTESLDHVQHILHENQVQVDERLEWLYKEIHKLDDIDRSISLLLLEDFSYKEIAGILGITESNVGVKINRIKKQLIAKSKKYDHGI
jgi:RNA polymerase sigma-70 factor (ECF subfamily)